MNQTHETTKKSNCKIKKQKILTLISHLCSSFHCVVGNKSDFEYAYNQTEEWFQEHPIINWDAIVWVDRHVVLWVIQFMLASVSLTEALLLAYLGYKVSQLFDMLILRFCFKDPTECRGEA